MVDGGVGPQRIDGRGRRGAASAADGDPAALVVASEVLSELRGAKSAAKVSMRTPITTATITDTPERLELLSAVIDDVAETAKVVDVRTAEGAALAVVALIEIPQTEPPGAFPTGEVVGAERTGRGTRPVRRGDPQAERRC